MQKISLFYLFILQKESHLESYHMNGHIYFLTTPTPKIFNVYHNQLNQLIFDIQ